MSDTLYVLAVLSALIAATEWLVRNTVMRHAGTAILVILVTATAANIGIIPASSTADAPVPAYDFIFDSVAPLAIFLLLLPVNLRDILKAGLPMITFFFIGSRATATGVVIAMWMIDGRETIGPLFHAIGGMFTGTYSGGSVNFNAIALHYNVTSDVIVVHGRRGNRQYYDHSLDGRNAIHS